MFPLLLQWGRRAGKYKVHLQTHFAVLGKIKWEGIFPFSFFFSEIFPDLSSFKYLLIKIG